MRNPTMGKSTPAIRALTISLACSVILSACGGSLLPPAHKIDVQQGNILKQESIEQIEPGMTKGQVRFLLGNPIIRDAFHTDRWDYLYFVTPAGSKPQASRLTLFFQDDKLVRLDDQYVESDF